MTPSYSNRLASSGIWSSLRTGASELIGLAVFVSLANLFLSEQEFGLVALVNSILIFSQVIARLGITTALVQRSEITDEHCNAAFWSTVAAGLTFAAIFIISAHQVSAAFREPLLEPLIRAMAPGVVIVLLGATHEALLTRELSFRVLAIRSLVASVGGGSLALATAASGYGAWSLVVLSLVTAAINLVTAWRAHPWRPRLHFHTASFRQLFETGAHVTGIGLVVYFYNHVDRLILASMVSVSQLGLYYFGKRLVSAVLELLGQSVNAVALPGFSKIAQDSDRVQRGLVRLTSVAAAISIPALLGLVILADLIVLTIFDERWSSAITVLQWLCVGGIPQALTYFASSVLIALGHPNAAFRATIVGTLIVIAASILGSFFGAEGVAIGFAAASGMMFIYYGNIFLRITGLTVKRYLLSIGPSLLAALIMVAFVSVVRALLQHIGVGEGMTLMLSIMAGIVTFIAGLRLADPSLYVFLVDNLTGFFRTIRTP